MNKIYLCTKKKISSGNFRIKVDLRRKTIDIKQLNEMYANNVQYFELPDIISHTVLTNITC